MPTLTQVRADVDARLAILWTTQIQPKEATYLVAHGRYWQGVKTTDLSFLVDNLTVTPLTLEMVPNLLGRPTDQAEAWTDVGIVLGATLPMALEIHTYEGLGGKGYVGIAWVKVNGTTYVRAQNNGPETWRTQAWQVYT